MTSAPPTAIDLPSAPKAPQGLPGERSRVPLFASVTLDSGLPTTTSTSLSNSSATASPRYVKQFQSLLEHQRQVFDEERALWEIERADLLARITQLEIALERHPSTSSSYIPASVPDNATADLRMSSWSAASTNGSRHTSNSTASDQVWRGSQSSDQPTRTFSDMSSFSGGKTSTKLPSISEDKDTRPPGGKKISFSEQSTVVESSPSNPVHKGSISGSLLSRSLDGINFKSAGLPPAIVHQVLKSSPDIQSPNSDSNVSPSTMISPPDALDLPRGLDPYTKDAGHTPIARLSKLVSLDASARSSNATATPAPAESEQIPLEPHSTRVRPPNERHDSYFPTVEKNQAGQDTKSGANEKQEEGHLPVVDDDQPLKGPLGLTNEKSSDVRFLSDLDRKLSDVVAAVTESRLVSHTSPTDTHTRPPNEPPPQMDNLVAAATGNSDKENERAQNGTNGAKNMNKETDLAAPSTPPQQTAAENGQAEAHGDAKSLQTPESEPRLRIKRSMNFGSAFGEGVVGRGF